MATDKQATYVADLFVQVNRVKYKKVLTEAERQGLIQQFKNLTHEQVQHEVERCRKELRMGPGGATAKQMALGANLQGELRRMGVGDAECAFDFRDATNAGADGEVKRLIALKRALEQQQRAAAAPVVDLAQRRRA